MQRPSKKANTTRKDMKEKRTNKSTYKGNTDKKRQKRHSRN